MLAPHTVGLGDIKVSAFALALRRLKEAQADRTKVPSCWERACGSLNSKLIGSTPVRYLVKIVKPGFVEARLPQTQRSIKSQRWCPGTIVSQCDIASSVVQNTVGSRVIGGQRSERALVGF